MKLLLLSLALALCQGSSVDLKYKPVLEHIRKHSQPDVIPIEKGSSRPLKLQLEISVRQVEDVKSSSVTLIVSHRYKWQDRNLAWDNRLTGMNVEQISLPTDMLFTPDTYLANSVGMSESLSPHRAVVRSDGTITLETREKVEVLLDTYRLYERGAKVALCYMSMTYSESDLSFEEPSNESINLDEFRSSEFQVSEPRAKKDTVSSSDTHSKYDKLSFTFYMRSKSSRKDRPE